MVKTLLIFLLFALAFSSCTAELPDKVQQELNKMSPVNKKKFEKVIKHYRGKKNELKLKASYFIIENINDFGFYQSAQLDKYDVFFDVLAAKPEDYKVKLPWYSSEVDHIFDSLETIYGKLNPNELQFKKDVDAFTTKSFITYIDDSFKAWENPWSKNLSFDEFCEYILPYRCSMEALESWRPMFTENFSWVKDSLTSDASLIDAARLINSDAELKYASGLGRYITSISPSNLLKGRFGSCADMSTFKSLALRSFGVPVCTDFIPQWGNDHNTHFWNAIMNENGELVSIDKVVGDKNARVAYKLQLAKVYRKTFSKQAKMLELQRFNKEDIPPLFQELRMVDVTDKYVPVSDYELSTEKLPDEIPVVYLCIFNDHGFTPIAFSEVENKKAKFIDMGQNVLYFPMFIKNKQFNIAGIPFVIDSNEVIHYKMPSSETENLVLTRKYYLHKRKKDWQNCLVNGVFQGANSADFSDAKTLAVIKKIPSQHMEEIKLSHTGKYTYFRFMFDASELKLGYDDDGASLAEIEFINTEGKVVKGKALGTDPQNYSEYTPDKCFDGNALTFFEDPRKDVVGKWVGLQLDKPEALTKIRYRSRNDLNNIQKGDLYELLVWNNQNFISLGQQVATDTMLVYKNCPKNAIFWLRNLSGGKEERIFTYENNSQIWW